MSYTVKEIKNGKFYMQLPDGKIVELKPGMAILPNSIVFGADSNDPNSELIIVGGKTPIVIKSFEMHVFDASMFENMKETEKITHENHKNHNENHKNHNENQHITEHKNTHETEQAKHHENINPAEMVTAAGNNQHTGVDFLQSEFENVNIHFNVINPAFDINVPIVTTGINGALVELNSNIIKVFLGTLNNDFGTVYESGLPFGTQAGIEPTVIKGNIFDNDTLNSAVKINNVNGVAPNADGIIQITTAEGNVFELNTKSGEYSYRLLHPLHDVVNGIHVDSLTQKFIVNVSDNYGHTAHETVAITVMDDKPEILGDMVNISASGNDVPQIVADIDITSQMIKNFAHVLDNLTPNTFTELKTALISNLGTIDQSIRDTVAVGNENQNYINLLKDLESKIVNYINNIEMKNAKEEVTIVHTDGTSEQYTVHDGDILYNTGNGYMLISNIKTHYVDPEALGVVKGKIDNLLENYSQVIPHSELIKSFADTLLTPDGINNLKTLIAEDKFDIHINVNGMHLDDGTLQINTIGVDALMGDNHITQSVTLADPAHLPENLTFTGKLFDTFAHDGVLYGADLGHIESLTVNNETYHFDPTSPTQTIQTQYGDMHVNFITGDVALQYNNQAINAPSALDIKQPMNITVVDGDGDTVSKNITLEFGADDKVPVIASEIHNIDLGAGNDTIAPVDLAHMPEALQSVATLLGITGVDKNIDFNNISDIKNIEIISLNKIDNANVDNLSLNEILNMTDNRNHLVIVGDNDSVNNIDTQGWSKVSEIHQNIPVDSQGHTAPATTYVYTNAHHEYVALTVNDQIDHTGL